MTELGIAPIETQYANCRFRSRLEARWAVVLDQMGVGWEYEPEGFETPCGRYLPDFRVTIFDDDIPGSKIWLEVKPSDFHVHDDHDGNTIGRWISVSRATGLMLVTACGLDTRTIVVTPGHVYVHPGQPGLVPVAAIAAGKSARFEFGERG